MNQNIKALWVKELRKPERKQARNALKTDAGNCCLGVLCEIAIEQGVDVVEHRDDNGNYWFDDKTGVLPVSVSRWAGLGGINDYESSNPRVKTPNALLEKVYGPHVYTNAQNVSLSTLNDKGATFAEIADMIEDSL